jgi:hypothetical protein
LAEPMPRRRAVRVIGASLVALAIPGVAPRVARGTASAGCPGDRRMCPTVVSGASGPDLPCGPPARRYGCPNPFDKAGRCVDLCPATKGIPCNSSKKDPDGCSMFQCCDRRFYVGCKSEKCQECEDNETLCFPADRGKGKCCKRGERCCFNGTSAACCGSDQSCDAATPGKQATCRCKPGQGQTCGSDCCRDGATCCDGALCCEKGDLCCGGECCDGALELCYVLKGVRGCVKNAKCKGNGSRCGLYCCGPGTTCRTRKGRKVCV